MNLQATANRHYFAIKDNPAAQVKVREEFAALSDAMLSGEASMDITSATVNGQSFSGTTSMTNQERFALLREVIRRLDTGVCYSNRTRAQFGYQY